MERPDGFNRHLLSLQWHLIEQMEPGKLGWLEAYRCTCHAEWHVFNAHQLEIVLAQIDRHLDFWRDHEPPQLQV